MVVIIVPVKHLRHIGILDEPVKRCCPIAAIPTLQKTAGLGLGEELLEVLYGIAAGKAGLDCLAAGLRQRRAAGKGRAQGVINLFDALIRHRGRGRRLARRFPLTLPYFLYSLVLDR